MRFILKVVVWGGLGRQSGGGRARRGPHDGKERGRGEGGKEGGREDVPSACFSSHSPLMGFWWRRIKCTWGGRGGREGGREGGRVKRERGGREGRREGRGEEYLVGAPAFIGTEHDDIGGLVV